MGAQPHGVPCVPGAHRFAFNGNCWACHWSKSELIKFAERTLELALTGKLGKQER